MKKLVIAISLVITSSVNVFSQKTDFDKFGFNNKVVNYILKGDYQKVIELTKNEYYTSTVVMDTNWQYGVFFNKNQNPLSDKEFIGYLSRIRDIVNSADLESAMKDPNGVMIEATNWSMIDDHLRGTPRENEMKTFAQRSYIFTKGKYTIYFILAFENYKLDAISFDFRVNNLE